MEKQTASPDRSGNLMDSLRKELKIPEDDPKGNERLEQYIDAVLKREKLTEDATLAKAAKEAGYRGDLESLRQELQEMHRTIEGSQKFEKTEQKKTLWEKVKSGFSSVGSTLWKYKWWILGAVAVGVGGYFLWQYWDAVKNVAQHIRDSVPNISKDAGKIATEAGKATDPKVALPGAGQYGPVSTVPDINPNFPYPTPGGTPLPPASLPPLPSGAGGMASPTMPDLPLGVPDYGGAGG